MNAVDLQNFIESHQISGKILFLEDPTPTVETAAQAVGAKPDQIVKSILFLVKGAPVLAIGCGTNPLDRRPIASRFGVGRKRVKLADGETVHRITGYPAGTVPPFGHAQTLPTLIDPGVLEHEQVYAGAGAVNALIRLDPQEILRSTEAEIMILQGR